MILKKQIKEFKYPGIRVAMDGNTAVIMCERESSDGAGAYPITPSTQMGEFWAEEVSKGHINISDKALVFIEPEGEHAAAGVTAGMSMTGLRATNFSSGQGIAYMHESLYAAVGKRLTYVLNIGCRAKTKAALNVHCGHDDYHSVDDTGFFQLMAKSAQEVADQNIICHKIAELALTPGICGQDGFLTTHLIETLQIPERELIAEYLGRPDDIIDTPTPAQRLIYGDKRRRIPEIWDVDRPLMSGSVQNQDAYMQSVAAQRPFFFDHIADIADQAMDEFYELTGRQYNRVSTYKTEDADYLIVSQGSIIVAAEAVADYLRTSRKLKVGVVNVTFFRPFPGDLLGEIMKGRKGIVVLERVDQPLAEDLPLIREIRACMNKCVENATAKSHKEELPYPNYAVYDRPRHSSPLFSGSHGLGSRDLQPEGIIGAVENMLKDGKKKKFFYLGVDFIREQPFSPKQEIHQESVEEAYPGIREMAVRGSENPNLLPKGSITVRIHSVGGWGAITTGKNLAMTLFDMMDYDIKANPKYGSEKKGQPTTYYLSAAPEPIPLNCEYKFVDVILSPDPNVFSHTNALSGLKEGGTFIIQSALESPEAVWNSMPWITQKTIVDKNIRIFYVDAFKIARDEASDTELQFRMQGIAFQGAFFAASPVMVNENLNENQLFDAIKKQLHSKFGSKGEQIVEDNVRVVRRGFEEVIEITEKEVADTPATTEKKKTNKLPIVLKSSPVNTDSASNIHRFWEQTGGFYDQGKGDDNLADPFMALSLMPATTGLFRDMTQIRFEHPVWVPEKCTACGDCYVICPDSAIPGLVNSITEIFETNVKLVEKKGHQVKHLRRAVRTVEKKLRAAITPLSEGTTLAPHFSKAIKETIAESDLEAHERQELETEFTWFNEAVGDFKFALTKPYHDVKEKHRPGSGGLFSITINPYTCKGCMECITICDDKALEIVTQTPESVEALRKDWDYWLNLPSTSEQFSRIDDLDECVGALETILLQKNNYDSLNCGDGACLGCGEKTAIHLFTGTVTALLQPRVQKHLAYLDELIEKMDRHIRLKLSKNINLTDTDAIENVINLHTDNDLTLSSLSNELEDNTSNQPVDPEWLKWATDLLTKLKHLKWLYTDGVTGNGRSSLGFINATGCTSVWGSTFPYNPYPFPWASHLFQDAPSVAMGLFEGHMAKMAEGFKAIRMTELELKGEYVADTHAHFFARFNWEQFTEEEFHLCPPVVACGGDGAMYDIGFQNLSRALMSGMPIKVMVVDTQVYSNTGGQACTSGFIGQVADMTPYGKEWKGKEEIRKEISLIAMAHRTSYVMQGAISNVTHLLEGYIEGLNSRRPAMWNIYTPCQPEHGIPDDASEMQSKLAVESRAYPLMKFNPDIGDTWEECLDLEGNPAMEDDWPSYNLEYEDESGIKSNMTVPMTFADFALTEGRFRKHFKIVPQEAWNDEMITVAKFLELQDDEREDLIPYIWAVDKDNHLMRVLVSEEIVTSTIERQGFWRLMKSIAGLDRVVNEDEIANQVRNDVVSKISSGLMSLATGGNAADLAASLSSTSAPGSVAGGNGSTPLSGLNGFEPVWIETPECTACDDCIDINPKIFAYNNEQKAIIVDPTAGSFKDIVKSAEKCPAEIIHPGTPVNPKEKDIEKLIKRAEKFQ